MFPSDIQTTSCYWSNNTKDAELVEMELHGKLIEPNLYGRYVFDCECGNHIDWGKGDLYNGIKCPECWKEYFVSGYFTPYLFTEKQDMLNDDLSLGSPMFVPAKPKLKPNVNIQQLTLWQSKETK